MNVITLKQLFVAWKLHVSGYEAAKSIFSLMESIRVRKEEKFVSMEFEQELANLHERLPFIDSVQVKVGKQTRREEIEIDVAYVEGMVHHFHGNVQIVNIFKSLDVNL